MNDPEKKQTRKILVERREFLGGAATLAGASITATLGHWIFRRWLAR
jgi:hypothetical protein